MVVNRYLSGILIYLELNRHKSDGNSKMAHPKNGCAISNSDQIQIKLRTFQRSILDTNTGVNRLAVLVDAGNLRLVCDIGSQQRIIQVLRFQRELDGFAEGVIK